MNGTSSSGKSSIAEQLLVVLDRRLLLAETDLPVTMIAADLGYSPSQHFVTAFRRDTGTTPSQYRRSSGR